MGCRRSIDTLGACKMRVMNAVALAALLLTTAGSTALAQDKPADAAASVAVGPQYDTAHVYVVPRRRGPLYRYCHRNVRRYQVPTSCFDNHPDAQQDDVAGGVHAGRHVLRVRFHEADPISVRPRTNRLPRDRHGYSNPIGDGQRSRRCRGTVRGSHWARCHRAVAGRRSYAAVLALDCAE